MKKTKSLNDLAITYRNSALKAINPGVPYSGYKPKSKVAIKRFNSARASKAHKSGNLYNQILSSNTQQTMVKPFGEDGFQIILNVAPYGAEYGEYVHYGVPNRMDKRPFGELALENPEFIQLFEKVMGEKVEEKVDDYFDKIDKDFKKAGFKVS